MTIFNFLPEALFLFWAMEKPQFYILALQRIQLVVNTNVAASFIRRRHVLLPIVVVVVTSSFSSSRVGLVSRVVSLPCAFHRAKVKKVPWLVLL